MNTNQPSAASVIWMHGLGADNRNFDSLIPSLTNHNALPLRFIFPNAPVRPVSINYNAPTRAWYDIYSLTNLNREDKAGVYESAALISRLVQDEIDRGVPANRIILAGFSQGGAMALYTGMRQAHKIAGILGLSCYLPLISEHENTIHAANIETPTLIIHGTQDMTLPIFIGKLGHDVVARTHKNTQWKEYIMQHEITPQEAQDIHQWFLKVLQ
jgi:phospholipase/carboxylesterase